MDTPCESGHVFVLQSVVHFAQDKKYESTRHQEVVSAKSRSIQA